MESTARELLALVGNLEQRLLQVTDAAAAAKPAPGKWSKKEILGHLIDSACNNQQKFVRTLLSEQTVDFVGYEQDAWVVIQQYQEQPWTELVALWVAYNRHLAHIIQGANGQKLQNTLRIEGNGPYTLSFLMADYVEHLKHHLLQIIPDAGITSAFSMTPYV